MGVFATIIFALSLAGIVFLFAFKAWEIRRGLVLAPSLREKADQKALHLKDYLLNSRQEAAKIVPLLGLMGRYLIHEGALGFARAAHFAGVQAHRLADFVSYKHRFERQEPRSEFLKRVGDSTSLVAPTPSTQSPSLDIEHSTIEAMSAATEVMMAPVLESVSIPEPIVEEPLVAAEPIIETTVATEASIELIAKMQKTLHKTTSRGTKKRAPAKKTSRSKKVEKEA